MQDALSASEEERNALKRQLAKLSKRFQQARALRMLGLLPRPPQHSGWRGCRAPAWHNTCAHHWHRSCS
jgi:hypothetical protein